MDKALVAIKIATTRPVWVVEEGGSGGYKRGSGRGKRLLI